MATPTNRFRRHRRKTLAILVLLGVLDVTFGTLQSWARQARVDDNDEKVYRTDSALLHHDLVPNTTTERAMWGVFYPVRTNSLGFRDAEVREVSLEAGDRHRILLLGDSFTEGVGVPWEDTLAGVLSEELGDEVEVLNAGVSSYSPVIYYAKARHLLEDVGLEVHEVVVLVDISDIEDEAEYYMLDDEDRVVRRPDEQPCVSQNQVGVEPPGPDRVEQLKVFLLNHFMSIRLAVLAKERWLTDPATSVTGLRRALWTVEDEPWRDYRERGLAEAQRNMTRLAELLAEHDIPLTLGVYPWPDQIARRDLESRQAVGWRAWAEEHEATFVDFFPEFIDDRPLSLVLDRYFIAGDVHWNAAGHHLIAEGLLEAR